MEQKIYHLNVSELANVVAEQVEKVFAKYIPQLQAELNREIELADTKTVCSVLKISRQTFVNWNKDEKRKNIIQPFMRKEGLRWSYDLEGLMQAIKQNNYIFRCGLFENL